jgi:hypothetical protein
MRPPRRFGFRRLPIRLRLTIVLTVVLAAGGVVLYTEFERDLDGLINRDLESRTADVAALLAGSSAPRATLAEGGEGVAQVYSADGRLIASTRRVARDRLLTVAETQRAAGAPLRIDRRDTAVGDIRFRAVSAQTAAGTRWSSPSARCSGGEIGRSITCATCS